MLSNKLILKARSKSMIFCYPMLHRKEFELKNSFDRKILEKI
jgi:hypothetical protein